MSREQEVTQVKPSVRRNFACPVLISSYLTAPIPWPPHAESSGVFFVNLFSFFFSSFRPGLPLAGSKYRLIIHI